MKDHVEISHLTKFHAFRVNRDQLMDLKTWSKNPFKLLSLHTAGAREIWIDQSGFSKREKSSVLTSSKRVRKGFEIRQLFSLEIVLNIHEKGFTFQKLINNSWAYYPIRWQKSVTCLHLYSRYRMIILKSPERVLISVSGEIGEQYINNEFTAELLMIIWLPWSLYKDH